ncbi:hypothetical protein ABT083_26840 [Streptomyces goshikiensis]|uniref:HoxN/HupN/NixA family nickel/cobalt transporter n=1 Tax=Streptomyces goshikiensis TaxID=1942 RepID=UPI00331C20C5
MAAFILSLHLIGWFTLVAIVTPEHHSIGAQTFGIGVTAYTLGMRHAFDADHIAAIDNTTRVAVEVIGLVAEKLDLHGPFWDWAGGLEWTAHLQPAGETPRQGQADQGGPDTRATR